jgi:hypothetical protein
MKKIFRIPKHGPGKWETVSARWPILGSFRKTQIRTPGWLGGKPRKRFVSQISGGAQWMLVPPLGSFRKTRYIADFTSRAPHGLASGLIAWVRFVDGSTGLSSRSGFIAWDLSPGLYRLSHYGPENTHFGDRKSTA